MSVEALLGTDAVFADDLQRLRPQHGQALAAANIRAMLAGSPIVASHKGPECTRVQDAYSLRCAPQVHGAARDTLGARRAGRRPRARIRRRQPRAHARRPRRVERQLPRSARRLRARLPGDRRRRRRRACRSAAPTASSTPPATRACTPFLAHEVGVDSGLMIAQYTAAGIVSELKRLAAPASVDSIPSSAMQEDHVSMGWAAARKLRRALDGLGPRARDRGHDRRARRRPARPAPARPRDRRGDRRPARQVAAAPAPTATSPPRSRPPTPSSVRRPPRRLPPPLTNRFLDLNPPTRRRGAD